MTDPSASPLHVELLATGDELLTGQILDTNSVWLMDRLWDLGVMARRKTLVADDRDDLAAALHETTSRSDLVVMSGGLGPTEDDLTAEVVAAAMGVPLELHEPSLEAIRERFRKLGREMTPNNAKQARFPQGATVIPNRFGTAPGFLVRLGRGELVALPGVPVEYRGLSEEFVLPRLAARTGSTPAFRLVKLFAVPESHADQAMRPVMDDPGNRGVRFGYRAHWPEIHVKWSVWGDPAESHADRILAQVRSIFGDAIFAEGKDELAPLVVAQLTRRGERVALAESCTGGLVAELLTRAPGLLRRLRPRRGRLREPGQDRRGRRTGRSAGHPRRGLRAGGAGARRGDPPRRRLHLGHWHHRDRRAHGRHAGEAPGHGVRRARRNVRHRGGAPGLAW